MPALFFTNLALLGGLAALAIPVLVHLLIKRKQLRLRFSTLQFFVQRDEQSSRRRRLRHWLLLAVRLLLVALLVLAFARPFTPAAPASASPARRAGIFVVDRTASLQAVTRGETAWNRSMALAQAALREFSPADQAALVTCSARTEVVSGWRPAPAITRLMDGLTPEFTRGNLVDALRAALKLAASREAGTAATIHLVSDLQRNSLAELSTVAVPADVEVKLINGGEPFASNLAVADLRLEGQVHPQAQIVLQSFSDEDQRGARMSLVVDGLEVVRLPVTLKAGETTNLVVALPAFKPGWHSAEARLESPDALAADNTRHHAFFIPEPTRVLFVETRSSARLHEQDSFHVASALQPEAEPGTRVPALFRVDLIDPSALADTLTQSNRGARYAAVVLPALRQIPAHAAEALMSHVRTGGGLLLFVGEGLSINRYNAEFRELLPLKLDSMETCANGASGGWILDAFDKSSVAFAAFRGDAAANLRLPEFTRRFRASSFAAAPDSTLSTLAAFDDGVPLMASRSVGAGRVVLVNTTADASWTDWPKRKSYVPWLHGVIHHLGGRSSIETLEPGRGVKALTPGEDADIALGAGWKSRALILHRGAAGAEKKGERVRTDEEGHLTGFGFSTPGIYGVSDTNGVELGRWAVNLPLAESELVGLTPPEWQKELVRAGKEKIPPESLHARLIGTATSGKEWWRLLLLSALGLLFAEVILANRTRA